MKLLKCLIVPLFLSISCDLDLEPLEESPQTADNTDNEESPGAIETDNGIYCLVNEHVLANECTPCPDGTTNSSGDDAAGPDTECLETRMDDCSIALGVSCSEFEEGYFKASNANPGDLFGWSVAFDGDTLAVGAPEEYGSATGIDGDQNDNSAQNSGAVYVFERSNNSWSQQAYIKASNTAPGDVFGVSVALNNETLVIGAYGEDSNATGIDGDQSNNSSVGSGAVYVFTRRNNTWSQQAYIKASNTNIENFSQRGELFGNTLALDGDTLAVGAPYEQSNATGIDGDQSNNSSWQNGAVYVFTRNGTTWSQQAYIKASNGEIWDRFGTSLALDGDTLAVGAPGESSNAAGIDGDQSDNSTEGAGAVYVFTRSGTTWSQQAYIKASNTEITGSRVLSVDRFGASLVLDGDTLAIAATGESSNATGIDGGQSDNSVKNSGAVYIFTRSGTIWSQQAYIKASNTAEWDLFGVGLALDGDTLAVGAPGESSSAIGINGDQSDNSMLGAGAVYVFTRSGITWSQQAYIKASNTIENYAFGSSLAFDGGTLAVGSRGESSNAIGINGDQSDNSARRSGAVYLRKIAP